MPACVTVTVVAPTFHLLPFFLHPYTLHSTTYSLSSVPSSYPICTPFHTSYSHPALLHFFCTLHFLLFCPTLSPHPLTLLHTLYSHSTHTYTHSCSISFQRVHLDLQIGEQAVNYPEVAAREKLGELHLRIRQLLDQIDQITKEQVYQRVGDTVQVDHASVVAA